MNIKIYLFSVLMFNASIANAYHLGEHESITRQAVAEIRKCWPESAAALVDDDLVRANLDEDLNLVVKELFYSHFYNPNRHLSMFRGSSWDRVTDLTPDLLQCRGSSIAEVAAQLGAVIHHLQDGTVPAHVVPVNHSFWDGFESLELTAAVNSGWTCDQMRSIPSDEPAALEQEVTKATLIAIDQARFRAKLFETQQTRILTGSEFWLDGAGGDFGEYGDLGNSFGSNELGNAQGETLSIASTDFNSFKSQQVRQAVRFTIRALLWQIGM